MLPSTGTPDDPGAGSRRSSYNSTGETSGGSESVDTAVYRVLMIGGPGVGKTALTQQFMTSEFMAAQNTSFGQYRFTHLPYETLLLHRLCDFWL